MEPVVSRVPRIYLAVGDKKNGKHPLFFSETGENGMYVKVASFNPKFYEVMCAAAEAYNAQRNTEGGDS